MSSLNLLAEALADLKGGSQSAFVAKMAGALMDRVLEDDPDIIAFADGRSILVEAFLADDTLGVAWWEKRGSAAWLPTPDTPLPLLGVIDTGERAWNATRFRKISVEEFGAKKARAFLRDGMIHSMPLRHEDVAQWDAGRALGSKQKSLLEQQKSVMEYCLTQFYYDDLPVKQKVGDLVALGGALPVDGLQYKDYEAFIQASSKHLHAQIINPRNFGVRFSEQTPVIESWWKQWMENPDYDSGLDVVAAMKKEKFDLSVIEAAEKYLFVREVMGATGESGKKKPGAAWDHVSRSVDGQKRGWTTGNDEGLAWHQALGVRPDMLTHALADPRVDWTLVGEGGKGIWDHLARAVLEGKAKASLKRLSKKHEPRLLPTNKPLFWRSWERWENHCQDFMEATVNSHPEFWLGDNKQQRNGILQSIEWWLTEDPRERSGASICLNALFDPIVDRSNFSDAVLFAMHIAGKVAHDLPGVVLHIPNAIEHPVASAQHDPKFAKQLWARFSKNNADKLIKAQAEAAIMGMGTATATARRTIRL